MNGYAPSHPQLGTVPSPFSPFDMSNGHLTKNERRKLHLESRPMHAATPPTTDANELPHPHTADLHPNEAVRNFKRKKRKIGNGAPAGGAGAGAYGAGGRLGQKGDAIHTSSSFDPIMLFTQPLDAQKLSINQISPLGTSYVSPAETDPSPSSPSLPSDAPPLPVPPTGDPSILHTQPSTDGPSVLPSPSLVQTPTWRGRIGRGGRIIFDRWDPFGSKLLLPTTISNGLSSIASASGPSPFPPSDSSLPSSSAFPLNKSLASAGVPLARGEDRQHPPPPRLLPMGGNGAAGRPVLKSAATLGVQQLNHLRQDRRGGGLPVFATMAVDRGRG
eukprot:TRINITY_DN6840_c0_g2_i1.p1 TRINITY_DN6840_c0_g2~~TRINITY_DN6840_c0_g2_i1.p1  ORF type:complete len:331 (+),score=50.89 TRINITY_DN6840_c0_g2_i1:597-1589(+)